MKTIIDSIHKTRSSIDNRLIKMIPDEKGIYAFYLKENSNLKEFGENGQLLYLGIASNSLQSRDIKQHLESGKTGWSSFRRSVGAILKEDLKLKAIKRDITRSKLRADKYKFEGNGENDLTDWIIKNCNLGFWSTTDTLTKADLKKLETQITVQLKPTLDLDRTTKKFNPLADKLDALRRICREEVKRAATNKG